MQLGMVGLGRMGGNMARRLMRGGHEIVGYAADPAGVKELAGEGGTGVIEALFRTFQELRAVARFAQKVCVCCPHAGKTFHARRSPLALLIE